MTTDFGNLNRRPAAKGPLRPARNTLPERKADPELEYELEEAARAAPRKRTARSRRALRDNSDFPDAQADSLTAQQPCQEHSPLAANEQDQVDDLLCYSDSDA